MGIGPGRGRGLDKLAGHTEIMMLNRGDHGRDGFGTQWNGSLHGGTRSVGSGVNTIQTRQ